MVAGALMRDRLKFYVVCWDIMASDLPLHLLMLQEVYHRGCEALDRILCKTQGTVIRYAFI
jgi:hypothetical protein